MRVLLDECVPRKLRREIANREVLTVTEHGWSGIENGELLKLAESEFDIFLTVDQNLSFQQNLKLRHWNYPDGGQEQPVENTVAAMPDVRVALDRVQAGEIIRIGEA